MTIDEFKKKLKAVNPNEGLIAPDKETASLIARLKGITPDLNLDPGGQKIRIKVGADNLLVYDLTKGKGVNLKGWGVLTDKEQSELYRLLIERCLAKKPFDDLTDDKVKEATTKIDPNYNEFAKYTNHLAETLKEKNDAYGDSFTKSVDDFGKTVIAVRLSDKFNRICNLIKRDEDKENDESLADTLLDMAGYSILALKYLEEHENKKDQLQPSNRFAL